MNKPHNFVRVPTPVAAIQRTNSKESTEAITVWVTDLGFLNYLSYSSVTPDKLFVEARSGLVEVRLKDWVVFEKGYLIVVSDEEFKSLFSFVN